MIIVIIEQEKVYHHNFPECTFYNKSYTIHKNSQFLFILSLVVAMFANTEIALYLKVETIIYCFICFFKNLKKQQFEVKSIIIVTIIITTTIFDVIIVLEKNSKNS